MTDPEIVDAAMDAVRGHVFADTTTCTCGEKPADATAWERHRIEVALEAAADAEVAALKRQWPGWLIGGIVLAIVVAGTVAVLVRS